MKSYIASIIICIAGCTTSPKYPDGGYNYPKDIAGSDTNLYYYQVKDIAPKRDAFYDSYAYLYYRPFDEPNLSIKPQPKETFRLTFSSAFGNMVIITFNEDSLIVKKGAPHILYNEDTSRLSAIENLQLRILKKRFPIDTTGKKPYVKRYLDSMVKLYPQLLDPAYYHQLYDKTITYTGEQFSPTIAKFPLTKQQYTSLIQDINASGYWTMPYETECGNLSADGYGFVFEANTARKYKIVQATGCPDDTTKFTKACQNIIKLAKMDKEINLIWSGKTEIVDDIEVTPIELEEIKPKPRHRKKK